MYNKNKIIFIGFISFLLAITSIAYSEELDIAADSVVIKKEQNIVEAEGSVSVEDKSGNQIFSDKTIYFRSKKNIGIFRKRDHKRYKRKYN